MGRGAAAGRVGGLARMSACLLGEGGREHQRLASLLRHVLLLDDPADLRLEAHVEHAVGLVEDEPAAVLQRDARTLHEVDEAAGRGDEQLAAALEVAELVADVGAAVDDDGAAA